MKSTKGQAIVEFALVIPIFIMLVFGILDFGRVFHAYLAIDHAGREAAREASIGTDDSTVINTAISQASSINLASSQVVVLPGGEKTSGTDVTVTITYPVDFLTPIISNIVDPITLTNSTTMRVE